MNFHSTEEQERFRQKVRDFFAKELPKNWNEVGPFNAETYEGEEVAHSLQRKMAQKGWLAMTWPKKYGGSERPHMDEVIFHEEMIYCTGGGVGCDHFGSGMFGPTLLIHGTEEQKMEHLPRIAKGEVIWCEGFSEPGAGSDLASLQLRAVEQGDHFCGQWAKGVDLGRSPCRLDLFPGAH